MHFSNYNEILAFIAVAKEGSFTKAAAKLGVSQSALSQTIRTLEQRLDLRLLVRTTRSVSPTEAGEHMLRTVAPRFDEIEAELAVLSERRLKPAGTIRISAGEHAALTVLQPKLTELLLQYPDIHVELIAENRMTDIVADRYDAGVRLGDQVAKDMIAVRISADLRWLVVGAPSYFARYPAPLAPQELTQHNCINMRLPTHGGIYIWDFAKDGKDLKVRVEGQLVFNNLGLRIKSALDGLGLAFLPEDQVRPYIEQGRLVSVLEDWCPVSPGYRLYYPSRRHPSSAFTLLVDALRHPG
ncbi:LysR family transcriptional regulator [Pseudoduganella sp. FT25W]|uniref:LysR family transcriptional regulator n=1 Tax=Duganella alba TaxID=2666081 RepID=A0A6L5QME0_9BURK|nr:LysR family transcriptional regulator [Duganella alba]MRX10940.1 LysR family transcriptional regulator [Duganella alba]MRX19062.1 LysR family transcriptional regulator [Duganella alba]